MQLSQNKILITGGASGLGFALAERFVNEGNEVIICGRRRHVLQEAKGKLPSLVTHICDLASDAEREKLFSWIAENHPDTNVLVNNAGIQNLMAIGDQNYFHRTREEIIINIEAPVHLSFLFQQLASLRVIINVTSGLSFVPLVKAPVYSGTKAFLHSYTLSLRQMLKPKGIEVIELIPPALNTDLGGKGIHDYAPPVSGFIESVFKQLAEGKNEISWGFSEQVSSIGSKELKDSFGRLNHLN